MADTQTPPAGEQAEAKLNAKQKAFVEHYLTHWNATKAAQQAGYSERTAQEQGSRLLSNVMVKAAVAARVAALTMGADEALVRLTDQARSTMADFLDDSNNIDLTAARRKGKLHLLRKVKRTERVTKQGDIIKTLEIELYDAQAALKLLGSAHGLFVDRLVTTDEQLLVQMDF